MAPVLVQSTSVTAMLRWVQPNDGGCPITTFSIYSDLGNQLAGFVNNLEPLSVNNQPYLFAYTFTFASNYTGQTMRFKLVATNEIGQTYSENFLQIQLAGVPSTPTTQVIRLSSTVNSIVIHMDEDQNNGGATLVNYEL